MFATLLVALAGQVADVATHLPARPLPQPSSHAWSAGRHWWVDGAKGDDQAAGDQAHPWRTIARALAAAEPGDTIALRGGSYREPVLVERSGAPGRPLIIRSAPGELAILDGGFPEFQESPETSWEPCPDGAPGEYRSTRPYPGLAEHPEGPHVFGAFADVWIPLQGYRFLGDLRSANEQFAELEGKTEAEGPGVYCGPGLCYDPADERIHVRLAPTRQAWLGDDNYRGETDPRRLRLVVAAGRERSPLTLRGVEHVQVEELAVRGARGPTILIDNCRDVTLDGVTSLGGSAALQVAATDGLRAVDCAFRGLAAPWTWRGSLKYRSIEARIVSASNWTPGVRGNRDFEFVHCEFTDCVDGVFLGDVAGARLHRCLLDNISDDGIFLTAGTAYDGMTRGGEVEVSQCRVSRCLTSFAFGVGHGRQRVTAAGKQTGTGVAVFGNVFDFRRPVMYQQPAAGATAITSYGRLAGDHGSPAWEPLRFYHNTILAPEAPWRGYYAGGLGGHITHGTRRELWNNLFVQLDGAPGAVLPESEVQLVAAGNLHWSLTEGAAGQDAFAAGLERFVRRAPAGSRWGERLRQLAATDHYGDPLLGIPGDVSLARDPGTVISLSPGAEGAAQGAGQPLPAVWTRPWSAEELGTVGRVPDRAPDCGAIPVGMRPWPVGVRGRLTVDGAPNDTESSERSSRVARLTARRQLSPPRPPSWRAAIVEGYPAFDSPPLRFALEQAGAAVDIHERRWLPVEQYVDYRIVAIDGSLARARVEPRTYSEDDIRQVTLFLEQGGTLLLMRGTHEVFGGEPGQRFLDAHLGARERLPQGAVPYRLREPDDPWASRLAEGGWAWLEHCAPTPLPIPQPRGQVIVGADDGRALLITARVGRGRLTYVGWQLTGALPDGRRPATVDDEASWDRQYRLLEALVR